MPRSWAPVDPFLSVSQLHSVLPPNDPPLLSSPYSSSLLLSSLEKWQRWFSIPVYFMPNKPGPQASRVLGPQRQGCCSPTCSLSIILLAFLLPASVLFQLQNLGFISCSESAFVLWTFKQSIVSLAPTLVPSLVLPQPLIPVTSSLHQLWPLGLQNWLHLLALCQCPLTEWGEMIVPCE